MSLVETITLPIHHFQEQNFPHRRSSSASTVPHLQPPPKSMAVRRNFTQPHQQPWSLRPTLPVISPPSASPFSPSQSSRPARNATEIIDGLYISDLAFAESSTALSSYRITHILSTLSDTIFHPPLPLLQEQPVRMQVRIEDMPFAELAAHLPTTTAFIRDAFASRPDARVLVHCAEGVSRSVSVVAAYLMALYGWSPAEAIKFIKSKRRIADPNPGFVQQLHEYARDSLGRANNSQALASPPFTAPL